MTRTPNLFIPLAIVLTTFIRAPASAWAATGVRFGVDQSLSGPAEASDPEIREVGLAVSPSNPSTVVAVFSDDFPRSRDILASACAHAQTSAIASVSPSVQMDFSVGTRDAVNVRRRCVNRVSHPDSA